MTKEDLKKKALKTANLLAKVYPDAECELLFKNPLQILIATILSAQCTDVKVNQVTPVLFRKFKSAKSFAEASQKDIEDIIKSLGLYRNKAKSIIVCCKELVSKFKGKVPDNIDELVTLAGVGRKTANCVMVNAFGKPGLMTDTHFCRITQRLGLVKSKEPPKIEKEIAGILPEKRWGDFSHQIIIHGRRCCKARNPLCEECTMQ
ncbi:MAG: endonuclease III, partial [Planctomycetota bacterium]